MSKRKLTYEDFKSYFFNRQKPDEKHQFEKDMMRDAFEEEAFDGLSMLTEEEFEQDIEQIKNKIKDRIKKRSHTIPLYFRYAAGIAIIIGIGLTSLYVFDNTYKNDLDFAEPMHESMALTDSIKPDEEKIALKKENEEISNKEAEKIDEAKVKKDFKAEKTAEAPKTIDLLTVSKDEDKADFDIETELDEHEPVAEIIVQEEAEEMEEIVVATNEQQKEEAEKTAETAPESRVQYKSTKEKGEKRNRTLFGTSKAKKSATGIASESAIDDAIPQPQALSQPQDREIIPPYNWIMDTLQSKLIIEIKNRIDLTSYTYRVDMTITIDTNGQIAQINHNKELPENVQNTIRDILNEFGSWKPAIENGQAVEKKVRIRFKLKP